MANEIEIFIGVNNVIKTSIIDSEDFINLKNDLVEIKWTQTKKRGVSRVWKNDVGNHFIEFYNQIAFKFNSKEELEKTKNVQFLRVPYSNSENKVSYISRIDESSFNRIKEAGIEKIDIPQLVFFGNFYQIKNSENVLVEWSKHFQKDKYSILENVQTMIGVDWELSNYLIDRTGERRTKKEKTDTHVEKEFKLSKGVHTNREDFKNELALVLNINQSILDFSIESLNQIEESLMWNADNLNTYNLVLPFTSYIGEILIKEKSLKWFKPDKYEYPILIDSKNQQYDLLWKLQEGLVDTDYGLPEVKWVFETFMQEIN